MAKDIDWGNLPFGYMETSKSFVANWKDGAWDEGTLTSDHTITMSECACVLQYAQTCFEGLKAYTTSDGKVVTFRPDLNADRMADSCTRLEMPVFPKEKFIQAVIDVVKANLDNVAYIRFASVYKDFCEASDFEEFVNKIDELAKQNKVEKKGE